MYPTLVIVIVASHLSVLERSIVPVAWQSGEVELEIRPSIAVHKNRKHRRACLSLNDISRLRVGVQTEISVSVGLPQELDGPEAYYEGVDRNLTTSPSSTVSQIL